MIETLRYNIQKREVLFDLRKEKVNMLKMKETALLIIDMQYGGGAPDGSLVRMLDVDVARQEDIVTPIAELKEFFRRNGMLIVNIKTEYEADFSDWPMLAERFDVRKYGHFVKGSADAEIIPPLAPREGEALIVKNRWNAFFNTGLDGLLKSRGIKNLVITGAATDVCVLETCSAAFSLNYNCIVPVETTASFSPERKKLGLELLGFGRSLVIRLDEVYRRLEQSGQNA
jgi:ureidoacrylate peracid hydrolase